MRLAAVFFAGMPSNPRIMPRRGSKPMTKSAPILFLAALLTLALSAAAGAEESEETCNALFVHSAQDVTMDADTLTMKGVSPTA